VEISVRKIILKYDDFTTPTSKAFLVVFDNISVWLPQSLTEIDESSKTLEIPLWLAIEKEIEDYEN
jgi:hypothetical protein